MYTAPNEKRQDSGNELTPDDQIRDEPLAITSPGTAGMIVSLNESFG